MPVTEMPQRTDLALRPGDSWARRFDCYDANGAPQPLTGTTRFRVKREGTVLIEKTAAAPVDGQISVAINPAETATLPLGYLVYTLENLRADGGLQTLVRGRLDVDVDP